MSEEELQSNADLGEQPIEQAQPVDMMAALKSEAEPEETTYYKPNGNGGTYWHFVKDTKNWESFGEAHIKDLLKLAGFPDYKTGGILTPLKAEIVRIVTQCRVFYAGPLAGYKMGVYKFEGEPALVTKPMNLIEPKRGKWDILHKVFKGAFAKDIDLDQRCHLFGWWQHTLQALYSGIHSPGSALVLAGERESGKSLVAELMKETMGQRFSQPYSWMTGKDPFNEELFASVLQLIDDENASNHLSDRLKFGAALKQMVAVPGARCRGLHQKATTLKPLWRLLMCLNMEPDRLLVLPPLDNDIEDKMIILKVYKNEMPMPSHSNADRPIFWNALCKELPAFVYYLLHEFELPKNLEGRFGVKFWHHPEVVAELDRVSPEQQTVEFIERWMRKCNVAEWTGTPTALRQELLADGVLNRIDQGLVEKSQWLGQRLRVLVKKFPDFYSFKRHGTHGRCYTINRMTPIENDVTRIDK